MDILQLLIGNSQEEKNFKFLKMHHLVKKKLKDRVHVDGSKDSHSNVTQFPLHNIT